MPVDTSDNRAKNIVSFLVRARHSLSSASGLFFFLAEVISFVISVFTLLDVATVVAADSVLCTLSPTARSLRTDA